ncbi:MAG: hypothetical protein VX742_06445, partial [Actinomycetota bacterium]|nr:hypothetical protein [Actinomycetota bacterium]
MLRHHNRLVVPLLITVLALFAAACGDANDATAETAADAGVPAYLLGPVGPHFSSEPWDMLVRLGTLRLSRFEMCPSAAPSQLWCVLSTLQLQAEGQHSPDGVTPQRISCQDGEQ